MIILEPVRIGELLGPMAALIVGAVQCWLIGLGLRRMDRAAEARARQMERRDRQDERRHQENMALWDRQHEQTLALWNRQHEQTMAQWNRQHEESMARHQENMTALRTLIERTADPGSGSRPPPP